MTGFHAYPTGHDREAIGLASINAPDAMLAMATSFHIRRLPENGITATGFVGAQRQIALVIRRGIQEGQIVGPRTIGRGNGAKGRACRPPAL